MTTTTIDLIAWVLCLATAVVGLTMKDVRLHGVTLAISLVMLVLFFVRH